ncbi:ArnT family glycosyltransferase [Elusimicrobiota bacterium]
MNRKHIRYYIYILLAFFLITACLSLLPVKMIEPCDLSYHKAMLIYGQGRFTLQEDDLKDESIRLMVILPRDQSGRPIFEKPPGQGLWLAFLHSAGLERLSNLFMGLIAVSLIYWVLLLCFRERDSNGNSKKVAFIASLLFITNPTFLAMHYRTYMSDLSGAVLVSLGLFLYLYSLRYSSKTAAFFSGVVVALSVMFKYTNVLAAVVVFIFEICLFLKERRMHYKNFAIFFSGFTLAIFPLIIYHVHYFGSPFSTGYDYRMGKSYFGWDGPVFSLKYLLLNFPPSIPRFLVGFPLVLLLPLGLFNIPKKLTAEKIFFIIWILVFGLSYLFYTRYAFNLYSPAEFSISFYYLCRKFLPILIPMAMLTAPAFMDMSLKKTTAVLVVLILFSLGAFTQYVSDLVVGDMHRQFEEYPSGFLGKVEKRNWDFNNDGVVDDLEKKAIHKFITMGKEYRW